MSELKPCPFCGHKDIGATDDGYAVCAYCEARMDVDTSNVSWNTRPIEDALRAEVERLNGRFDTAHQVIAHRENECAMLRAEVAALQADCRKLEMAKAEAEALAMSYEGTAERLKAELAKYTEPLTDEQAHNVAKLRGNDGTPDEFYRDIDAAIRRVRGAE